MPIQQSIVLADVSFAFDPLGDPVLSGLNATLPPGRIGIVGRNGTGKSTLLRLLTGELTPTSGRVGVPGEVAHVPQDLFRRPEATVAELLGIGDVMSAISEIEAGSIDPGHYDAVADRWDIEARALELLSRRVPSLATSDDPLARSAGTLSGGELVLTALVGLELAGADISVLDEPTNNLDSPARHALYEAVREWRGTLVVVSHDVALLNLVDQICELHDGELRVFGGNYELYLEQLAGMTAAAEREVRSATQKLRAEQRERDHVQTAMDRRARQNSAAFTRVKGGPRLSDPTAKRSAEARRAGEVKQASAQVREAREKVEAAEAAIRDDDRIRVDIIDPGVAKGRRLAELVGANRTVHVMGGDRIALAGGNGVGKTTLLRSLLDPSSPSHLVATGRLLTERVGYLDQSLAMDDAASVLEVVAAAAPSRVPQEIRGQLARFLIRGEMVEQPVGTLSGGERFRVALARLLLADPPPELLVLDEPTNNLDLDSVQALVDGLTAYHGALLIVSHDEELLDRLGLDAVVTLDREGNLA